MQEWEAIVFMPPPPIAAAEALCFRVVWCSACLCPSVCPYVRECVRAFVLLARYLRTQLRPTEFHQTLFDDVVEAMNELVRFEGRRVKVKVATRSNIWVSYCGGRRQRHRRWPIRCLCCKVDRYKYVVVVTIGPTANNELVVASRCLLNPDVDTYVSYTYDERGLFAVATVYAFYREWRFTKLTHVNAVQKLVPVYRTALV